MKFTTEMSDRLYTRFQEIYGENYRHSFIQASLLKTIFCSAFSDLTVEEIRQGLVTAKRYSHKIPSIIEFWHWCKNKPYGYKPRKGNIQWNSRSRYR